MWESIGIKLVLDLIMSWWNGKNAKNDQALAVAAQLQKDAEEKDHEIAQKIRTEQGALSDADVDRLLTDPKDRKPS